MRKEENERASSQVFHSDSPVPLTELNHQEVQT